MASAPSKKEQPNNLNHYYDDRGNMFSDLDAGPKGSAKLGFKDRIIEGAANAIETIGKFVKRVVKAITGKEIGIKPKNTSETLPMPPSTKFDTSKPLDKPLEYMDSLEQAFELQKKIQQAQYPKSAAYKIPNLSPTQNLNTDTPKDKSVRSPMSYRNAEGQEIEQIAGKDVVYTRDPVFSNDPGYGQDLGTTTRIVPPKEDSQYVELDKERFKALEKFAEKNGIAPKKGTFETQSDFETGGTAQGTYKTTVYKLSEAQSNKFQQSLNIQELNANKGIPKNVGQEATNIRNSISNENLVSGTNQAENSQPPPDNTPQKTRTSNNRSIG